MWGLGVLRGAGWQGNELVHPDPEQQQQQMGDAERGFGWLWRLPAAEEAGRALQLCSPDCCGCS